jgi:hypothetical protein
MNDPRKPIFDAIRTATPGGNPFDVPGRIAQLHALLDSWGVRRADAPSAPPAPPDPIPPGYFEMLARIESGNRPYVKAPTSSASGLYQFIRSTWIAEGGAWGPDMSKAFGGLKPSIEEQTARARSFTMKNLRALQAAGIPINAATLYAAHFLGAGTAIRMLKTPLDAKAADIAGAAAARANPSILGGGRTVRQFREWLERKTGVRP